MSKIRHILSVIHYKIRGAVRFQLTHFPCDDWENIYILSYYHHQIGSMNYYPLFRVRSWNNGLRCMSFCILLINLLVQGCDCGRVLYVFPFHSVTFSPYAHCISCVSTSTLGIFCRLGLFYWPYINQRTPTEYIIILKSSGLTSIWHRPVYTTANIPLKYIPVILR